MSVVEFNDIYRAYHRGKNVLSGLTFSLEEVEVHVAVLAVCIVGKVSARAHGTPEIAPRCCFNVHVKRKRGDFVHFWVEIPSVAIDQIFDVAALMP